MGSHWGQRPRASATRRRAPGQLRLTAHTPGAAWLIGGTAGPEASLLAAPAMALTIIAAAWRARPKLEGQGLCPGAFSPT